MEGSIVKRPAFTLSKLKTMAARRQDWLFNIMPVGDEFGDEFNLSVLASNRLDIHLKSRSRLARFFGLNKKNYYDFLDEIKEDSEYNKKVSDLKKILKKEVQRKYKLIGTNPVKFGMYVDYEFCIQDTETGLYYVGKCDNYGGENGPSVDFYEVDLSDEQVKSEITKWIINQL